MLCFSLFCKKGKKASWEAASSTAASVQRSRGKWGEKANFPSSQCHIAHITEAHQKNPDRKHVFSISCMNEYCRAMGVGWPGDCVFRKLESIPTALLPIFQVHHCLWWHSGSSMCPNLGNFNGFICSVFELVRTRLCFCTGRSLCFQRTQNPLCCFDVDGHLDPLPSALHRLITWQFITVSSRRSQSLVEHFRSYLWWPFTAGTSTKRSSRLGFFSSFSYAPQCIFTGRIWLSLSGLCWLLKDFSFSFSKRASHRVTSRGECFLGSAESWSCSLGQAQIF